MIGYGGSLSGEDGGGSPEPSWGSISLAQSLLGAGLVDEIQLHVVPAVLGRGRNLITEDIGRRNLALLEAKSYACGIVSLRYAVTSS